jgi:peptidoglycan/LPS O-acetylase OafA/YrhL
MRSGPPPGKPTSAGRRPPPGTSDPGGQLATTMKPVPKAGGLQNPGTSRRRGRAVAIIMTVVAATLLVASLLHLAGLVHGHAKPFNPTAAGIAEAVIAAVLIWGASAIVRSNRRGRPVALGTIIFAIAGFVFGLTFTIQGGDLPDITYHATMLPLVITCLVMLLGVRIPRRS